MDFYYIDESGYVTDEGIELLQDATTRIISNLHLLVSQPTDWHSPQPLYQDCIEDDWIEAYRC